MYTHGAIMHYFVMIRKVMMRKVKIRIVIITVTIMSIIQTIELTCCRVKFPINILFNFEFTFNGSQVLHFRRDTCQITG